MKQWKEKYNYTNRLSRSCKNCRNRNTEGNVCKLGEFVTDSDGVCDLHGFTKSFLAHCGIVS